MGRLAFVASVGLVMALLAACSVSFPGLQTSSVPFNEGRRVDMVIEPSTQRDGDLTAMIRAAWTDSPALASWFVIVDRVVDPAETVVLEYEFRGVTRSSNVVGSPKYGYDTVYSTRAELIFSLIDMRSGTVLASSAGSGSASGDDQGARDRRAIRGAVASGLERLMVSYSGGRR